MPTLSAEVDTAQHTFAKIDLRGKIPETVRRFTGTRVAPSVAILAALLIAIFLEPLPPLIALERSDVWTRLTEWLGLSLVGLVVLSLMGFGDAEFELSTNGIRVRPASAPKQITGLSPAAAEELKQELAETLQDNRALQRLVQHHREEQERLLDLSIRPAGGPREDDDA